MLFFETRPINFTLSCSSDVSVHESRCTIQSLKIKGNKLQFFKKKLVHVISIQKLTTIKCIYELICKTQIKRQL